MLSALDLARRIEAGELKPAAVIDLCAEAIAAREEQVGAFVALDIERACKIAQTHVAKLAARPLRGLPLGIKDIFDTVDFPSEYGADLYAGHRPRADSALVSQVHRAGGSVLGKTVTTEFAHAKPGRTRNPRNLDHTPGGSSSGSVAAVAAGMLPITIGSQTAGSVIRPASFVGIAAIKPSYGLLPMVGAKCFSWTLDTAGVFAADVADVAFATAAITGRDLRVDGKTPAAPRIGYLHTQPWPDASDDMRKAVETTARAAEKAGAKVSKITLPKIFGDAFAAHAVIQDYEAYRALAYEYDHHRDRMARTLRDLMEGAAKITPEAYDEARRTTHHARRALHEAMAGIDVILTPSAPGAAPHGLTSTGSHTFDRLWTLMGTPCVNIPGQTDPSGLPLGVQLIGPFGDDHAVLEAALFVEGALGRRR